MTVTRWPAVAVLTLVASSHALLLQPLRRCPPALRSATPRACAFAGSGLSGPFWDTFSEEMTAEAEALSLTIEEVSFGGGTLSIVASGAGVDELQQLNNRLSQYLDVHADDEEVASLPPFLLEVSSPGLSNRLQSDMDFAAFKGFPVTVETTEPFKKKSSWDGTLVGRDSEFVTINLVRATPCAFLDAASAHAQADMCGCVPVTTIAEGAAAENSGGARRGGAPA